MQTTRRDFIRRSIASVAAGIAAASAANPVTAQTLTNSTRVHLVKGADRRRTVYNALKPFQADIARGIQGKRIFVKPNNVEGDHPLCATHADALRAVVDILREVTSAPITIAESSAYRQGTMVTFEQYGYFPVRDEYKDVTLYDLNTSTSTTRWIHDRQLMPYSVEVIDEFLDPDIYWISTAITKTHNYAVGTLGAKNMLMASPLNVLRTDERYDTLRNQKQRMHMGGMLAFNWNMFQLARDVRPNFVLIDAHEGMEGRGPSQGTPVEHNIALAGPDVVACDRIGLELMGIDWEDVGYLQWCAAAGYGQGNRDLIEVTGEPVAANIIKYEPHPGYASELDWKLGGTPVTSGGPQGAPRQRAPRTQ